MRTVVNWIPVIERPLTEEEHEIFGDDFISMLDGNLPYNGQSVLVSSIDGVDQTVFYDDEYRFFEAYEVGEILAWAPLPEPYTERRE